LTNYGKFDNINHVANEQDGGKKLSSNPYRVSHSHDHRPSYKGDFSMKYVHVKNIDKYHPGYRDRNLSWCKSYFTMINADPDFEMVDEINKWRYIALVMLELQIKKPVPLSKDYLKRKGFDLKKCSIDKTVQMLHNFVSIVTEDLKTCGVDKEEEEDKEEEKEKSTVTKTKHQDYVLLSPDEYSTLTEKYGKSIITQYIDKLNNYIGSKGKKYKSHYFTILAWINKDNIRPIPPELKSEPDTQMSTEEREKMSKAYNSFLSKQLPKIGKTL